MDSGQPTLTQNKSDHVQRYRSFADRKRTRGSTLSHSDQPSYPTCIIKAQRDRIYRYLFAPILKKLPVMHSHDLTQHLYFSKNATRSLTKRIEYFQFILFVLSILLCPIMSVFNVQESMSKTRLPQVAYE